MIRKIQMTSTKHEGGLVSWLFTNPTYIRNNWSLQWFSHNCSGSPVNFYYSTRILETGCWPRERHSLVSLLKHSQTLRTCCLCISATLQSIQASCTTVLDMIHNSAPLIHDYQPQCSQIKTHPPMNGEVSQGQDLDLCFNDVRWWYICTSQHKSLLSWSMLWIPAVASVVE